MSEKELIRNILKIFIGFCIMFSLFAIYIVIMLSKDKPNVTNNYNIEHVDTIVIRDSEEPIISDKPFNTEESNNDIKIFQGTSCSDLNFYDMGFETPVFKFINLKINNWVLKEEYQKILYEKCKKYNINYIKALAITYKEGSRNNPYAEHYNSNGSCDIGIMQFNSGNIDILKKITNSTDLEHLKNPETNIECALYLMYRNETSYKDISLYDSLVVYNGGYGSLINIKNGKYTLNCPASVYAGEVINYMHELYLYYINKEV